MRRHLVFYDGSCGLCDHAVYFILKRDTAHDFIFSPLNGETAERFLKGVPRDDSVILIENYATNPQMYLYGQAAFRILWLLGGGYRLAGWVGFLPPFLYNWAYRLVARNRHRFFRKNDCPLPGPHDKERFLP